MQVKALVLLALFLGPAIAADSWSDDYKRGWCDGWNRAAKENMAARDHYRSLVGAPKQSHDEVIKWIYSLPWIDGPILRTAPRRLDQPPGVPQNGPPPLEAIDLYLLLMEIHGHVTIQDSDGWHELLCN